MKAATVVLLLVAGVVLAAADKKKSDGGKASTRFLGPGFGANHNFQAGLGGFHASSSLGVGKHPGALGISGHHAVGPFGISGQHGVGVGGHHGAGIGGHHGAGIGGHHGIGIGGQHGIGIGGIGIGGHHGIGIGGHLPGLGGLGGIGTYPSPVAPPSTCRYWCRTDKNQAYCCEDNSQIPTPTGVVKPGFCPPVRPVCPHTRSFQPPATCSKDGACGGYDKCCFDQCLKQHICKAPVHHF